MEAGGIEVTQDSQGKQGFYDEVARNAARAESVPFIDPNERLLIQLYRLADTNQRAAIIQIAEYIVGKNDADGVPAEENH